MNLLLLAIHKIDNEENQMSDNDIEIDRAILNISKGKIESMETLYKLSKSSVYGYVLSIIRNKHEAEDILQDTYVKVYTSADTYKSQGKPLAWIFTIARNLTLMKIRSSKKVVALNETFDETYSEDEMMDVGDKMVIRAIMSELTSEESQIVMMYVVAGFKQKEIAAHLNLPISTVTSKYNRSIAKLRKKLEGGYYE